MAGEHLIRRLSWGARKRFFHIYFSSWFMVSSTYEKGTDAEENSIYRAASGIPFIQFPRQRRFSDQTRRNVLIWNLDWSCTSACYVGIQSSLNVNSAERNVFTKKFFWKTFNLLIGTQWEISATLLDSMFENQMKFKFFEWFKIVNSNQIFSK